MRLMQIILILAVTATFSSASTKLAEMAEDALKEAEEILAEEMRDEMRQGAQTVRRGKKMTDRSKEMGLRNALFSRAKKTLLSKGSDFTKEEQRRALANAIEKRTDGATDRRRRMRLRPDGFGHMPVESITFFDDVCDENAEDMLDCETEEDGKWRRIDGRCNNKNNAFWGSSGIPMRRMALPRYQDLLDEPLGGKDSLAEPPTSGLMHTPFFNLVKPRCRAGPPEHLPSARLVSSTIHGDLNKPAKKISHMLTQMGQFLDHDVTFTPEAHQDAEHCCDDNSKTNCFAIRIPEDDPFYSKRMINQTCMEFGRSEQFCAQTGGIREQINGITAFVDASNVYGSDDERAARLRTGQDGMLRLDDQGLLPKETVEGVEMRIAGDVRALEMPGLASMHTIFVREHNRIAEEILQSGTAMGTPEEIDENVYQRARQAVVAQMQKIVYRDYLPKVVGDLAMRDNQMEPDENGRTEYKRKTDPSILNEFATAAYRFGHSMIEGHIEMWTSQATKVSESNDLRKLFFDLAKYEHNDGEGVDMIIAGLINQASQDNDAAVSKEVTEHLFQEDTEEFGRDLVAMNIQRGRDHGLPGYNAVRQACQLDPVCSWVQAPTEIFTKSISAWHKLQKMYQPLFVEPGDLDLFTVGLLEDHVEGGVTGPTFSCIIANQFQRLLHGDRFFYSHPPADAPGSNSNGLSDAQLREVNKRTLRDVICQNTNVGRASLDVFLMPNKKRNPVVDCDRFNRLDSSLF